MTLLLAIACLDYSIQPGDQILDDPNRDYDGDGFTIEDGDCHDQDASVYPDAPEICDGLDNDCDDVADEDLTTSGWLDADGDGFGDPLSERSDCADDGAFVDNADDCDDTAAAVNPFALEDCNDVDDDCDGDVDEGLLAPGYLDEDGDGFGTSLGEYCPDDTLVDVGDDCDDDEDTVFPGADEVCDDAIDQDCDGEDARCPATFLGWAASVSAADAATWTFTTYYPSDAALGDLDGDGLDDLVTGDSQYNEAYVFFAKNLPESGPLASTDADIVIQGGEDFSWRLAIGEYDGDGRADLMIGQREHQPSDGVGEVWVLSGGDLDFVSGTVDVTAVASVRLEGESDGDQASNSILWADVDGDGLDDAVVNDDQTGGGAGTAYVLFASTLVDLDGETESLGDAADLRIDGTSNYLGISMAVCDVDADGAAELFVSESYGQAWGFRSADLVAGAALDLADAAWDFQGSSSSQDATDLSCAEVDGGTGDDLLLASDKGSRAYLLVGTSLDEGTFVLESDYDYELQGSSSFAREGDLADVDGDGRFDMVTGGPTGAVQLRLGSPLSDPPEAVTSFTGLDFGHPQIQHGDINDDGLHDLVFADQDAGIVYVLVTPGE